MAQHSHPASSHRGPVAQAADPGIPPEVFTAAVGGIAALRPRPGVQFEPLPAPRRLASFSHALSASVAQWREDEDEEVETGSGRFVLLYEPDGHEEWLGSWRCVTFLQADLEPEIAEDPLLAEVTWSWLCEALSGLGCAALGGTVSRCGSSGFGELADQGTSTSLELRASWTPRPAVPEGAADGLRGRLAEARAAAVAGTPWAQWTPQDAWDGLAAHVQAWADCLATVAGLPPELAGVARLPRMNG